MKHGSTIRAHDQWQLLCDSSLLARLINVLLHMRARRWFKLSSRLRAGLIVLPAIMPFALFAPAQCQNLTIDAQISKDNASPSSSISTSTFTTTSAKELLLAFIASDSTSSPNAVVISVAGGGLIWQPVQRTNVQLGTAEIWRAFATTTLTNARVTAKFSQSVDSSLTVVSIIGADPSGINGAGAIGAMGTGNGGGGAPTASLVTTRNNSWVFGVGNDWNNAITRSPGPNQSIVHQFLAPVNDTYWVQQLNAPTVQSGTTVTLNDTSPTSDSYNLSVVEVLPAQNPSPNGPLSVDFQVSSDKSTASTTNSTPTFSTAANNELLLTFVSSDNKIAPNTTVTGVSGGGLMWQLVQRVNVQLGTSEIWRAFAVTPLSAASVTVTLSQSVASSITVLGFIGADPSGTNGSGAIGALGSGNDVTGSPSASLVTTRNYSWVFAVGNDWDNAIIRTPGSNQSLLHQYLATVNDTYWVQAQNMPTAQSGATVVINDTAPTTDRFNVSLVEVLPAIVTAPPQIAATLGPVPNAQGWNNSDVTVTFQCSGGVLPVECPPPQLVTSQGRNQIVTAIAVDAAGQRGSVSIAVSIDKAAPFVTATSSPAANLTGWSTTPVTVSFTCSDSLSGVAVCPSPISFASEGANQIIVATATDNAGNLGRATLAVNIDLSPPRIFAVQDPSPNDAGWTNAPTTVSFLCNDAISGIATCPAAQAVTSDGPNQTISATAVNNAGNSSSTSTIVNQDQIPPVLTISSPSDGSTVSVGTLRVTGMAVDTLSGISTVTCSGASATFSGGNFSCNLTLMGGANVIQVQATDVAGNTTASSINVMYVVPLSPPPDSIVITPSTMTMALAETRQLALVDDYGRTIPGTNWVTSDPTIASIALDSTVRAIAPGQVSITGSYMGLSAQAQLIVSGSSVLPAGTVRWVVSPSAGNSMVALKPGPPPDNENPGVPAAYAFETGTSGLLLRALTLDGRQQWSSVISPTVSTPLASPSVMKTGTVTRPLSRVPHAQQWRNPKIAKLMGQVPKSAVTPFDGVAMVSPSESTAASANGVKQELLSSATSSYGDQIINIFERQNSYPYTDRDSIIVKDKNGNELWRHSVDGGEMGFALHPAGIVYILQADYINNSTFTLFAFDEFTGNGRFSIILPFSFGGQLQPFPGIPSVLPDGNLYLPVETMADYAAPDVLQLLQVAPDGTYKYYPVTQKPGCDGPVIEAHEVVPDSDSTFLLTWDYFGNVSLCNSGVTPPVQVTRMSNTGDILNSYSLPPMLLLNSYFSDNDGDTAISDDATVATTDRPGNVVKYDAVTGNILFVTPPAPPPATCTSCSSSFDPLAIAGAGDLLIVGQFYDFGNNIITDFLNSIDSYGVSSLMMPANTGCSDMTFWFGDEFGCIFQPTASSGVAYLGFAGIAGPQSKPRELSHWAGVSQLSTRTSWVDTKEETVVGWINGPGWGPSPSLSPSLALKIALNNSCALTALSFLEGSRLLIQSDVDRQYTNAFFLSRSGNNDPGATIDPTTLQANKDYRLFNDVKARIYSQGGKIQRVTYSKTPPATAGPTVDPCGVFSITNSRMQPDTNPDNGSTGLDNTQTHAYQLAEGRVGDEGQRINWVINFCSSSICNVSQANYKSYTPWIWSALTFDVNGAVIIDPSLHQVAPTYSIYENGNRKTVDAQSALDTFVRQYNEQNSRFSVDLLP